jgi:hypothetical protein
MVSVQDLTLIYTYLQLPQYYSKKVSSIQEVGLLITYHLTLRIYLITGNDSNQS